MKQMKFSLVALMVLLMGVSVTSCMKDDNESSFDLALNATVVDGGGLVTLLGDDGKTYYPDNPQILRPNGEATYPKRVFVYLKYLEQDATSSSLANVRIVSGGSLYTRSLCTRPDTIKNDIPLNRLNDFMLLDAKTVNMIYDVPSYCNISFNVSVGSSTIILDLVPVSANGNELTVKLQQTVGQTANYATAIDGYASFSMPSVPEINNALELYAQKEGKEKTTLVPSSDNKVKIKVISTLQNGGTSELPAKEVKISNY